MTEREVLDLAIGALADIAFSDMSLEVARNKAKRIYEEARAALAAPSAEPVAWLYHDASSLDALLAAEQAGSSVHSVVMSLQRQSYYRNETPLYLATPAQPPAAQAVEGNLPPRIWLNDMGTAQKLSFKPLAGSYEHFEYVPAAAQSVEVEPVRRLVDAAMAVISKHDEWVRQMPTGAFDDPLSVSLAALHDAAETVGISLDIAPKLEQPK